MIKTEKEEKKAVVLLSGGVDSTTVLAIARSEGYSNYCLSFAYGQRQLVELAKARQSAKILGCKKHLILSVEIDKIGGSALTGSIDVPKDRTKEAMESSVPVTYVPARNTIFLAYATAWAEVIGAQDIFLGINNLDYSGYPDCRPEFLTAFEKTANLGTKAGAEGRKHFTIHAPLMYLNKKEIIVKGVSLGVDYAATHSCYDPDQAGLPCGRCDACQLRLKGFAEAGLKDPLTYQPANKDR